MANKISFKRAWQISCIEYYKWLINPRMIVVVLMIIFVWNFSVSPLVEISREMGSPLNVLEPFIATLNSRTLCLVTPSVYLFLISDYPRLDRNSLFTLHRIPKREWVLGQFFFFLLSSFSFLLMILLCSVIPNAADSFVANGWSLVVTSYGIYFPERSGQYAATLITKELYNQLPPFHTAAITFMLSFLYLILLAMLLLLFYVFNARKVGMVASASVIAVGSALGMIKSSGMWIFPMAHTMTSLHFTEYYRKPVMPLQNSVIYFVCNILVLLTACLLAVRHTNFLMIDDNG